MTSFRHLAMIAALVAAQPASAQGYQDLDAIDAAVTASGSPARPVDRRLRLAACGEALQIGAPALGAVAVGCAAQGWRIRVPLLSTGRTERVIIIRRGDPVTLTTESNGFSVSASGTAESDGAVGERIRLRIEKTGPAVMGEVIDAGTVRISSLK